ncbi:MAG TPA: lysylphosphatidylglycerol synthase transmembrane domain-containing protein [Jatrophihabitans sp.]|nr:lysylphosphatidylglycerol synthase transmembrane domain-containing protein [Jatrophihabitans sp.]
MSRTAGWVRPAGGAVILAVLVWRLGTDAFLHGLRTVRCRPLLAAAAITGATTVCSAMRWRLVARGLGAELRLPAAIGYYYRSQFLNSALPGGVLGDVHRGLGQGRASGDVGRGLRAMVWDRAAGQAVQLLLAVAVLAGFASPLRPVLPVLGGCFVLLAGLLVALLAATRSRPPRREARPPCREGTSRWRMCRLARLIRTTRADLAVLRGASGVLIALSSAAVVAGHAAVFLIAARTAGTAGSPGLLLPLAVLVLLGMAVPLNVGGWGPREGVAAWAFGAAGLGMSQGVAVATVYGVMSFVATLPGAAVLVADLLRRGRVRPLVPQLPVGAHG